MQHAHGKLSAEEADAKPRQVTTDKGRLCKILGGHQWEKRADIRGKGDDFKYCFITARICSRDNLTGRTIKSRNKHG